ncbi:MAG: DNA translocase FtsK [Firmicutes bacterium]|nr:DNA translocase FtsK [Bacillota bacterium]
MLRDELKWEIVGVALIALAALVVATLYFGSGGLIGTMVVDGLRWAFGDGAWVLPLVVAWFGGWILWNRRHVTLTPRLVGVILLFLTMQGIMHLSMLPADGLLAEGFQRAGGALGAGLAWLLFRGFGPIGQWVVLVAVALVALIMAVDRSMQSVLIWAKQKLVALFSGLWRRLVGFVTVPVAEEAAAAEPDQASEEEAESVEDEEFADDDPADDGPSGPIIHGPYVEASKAINANLAKKGRGRGKAGKGGKAARSAEPEENVEEDVEVEEEQAPPYELPPTTLLALPPKAKNQSAKDLQERARLLEKTLEAFGVKASVSEIHPGPTVTRFELAPAAGVRVNRITSLADDLALALAARDIRIEAPIPGKSAVGIEVPNRETTAVILRDVAESQEFQSHSSKLAVVFGKDIAGRPVVHALDRMPHVLIAGSTGSGKSVCINSLICSLMLKARPDEVKLMMIDPKMVELVGYNGIPHLIAPVVTDPKKAAGFLRWAVKEMESRYEAFAAAGVRDITRYNQLKAEQRDELPPEKGGRPALPFIVVIVDELADLMMVAPVDVEDAICRLAQMARAAGIHLVVATQRPSVDVITGLIKANIPSRIAFTVASQVDSRTILDQGGAEKLLGKGDMLFFPVGASKPLRAQGAFVSEKEVEALVAFAKVQGQPEHLAEPLELEGGDGGGRGGKGRGGNAKEGAMDELLPKAVQIVIEHGQASVSILQRRLRINYNRAVRLIDDMEAQGLIGPHRGSKPRDVLVSMADLERLFSHRAQNEDEAYGDGEEE